MAGKPKEKLCPKSTSTSFLRVKRAKAGGLKRKIRMNSMLCWAWPWKPRWSSPWDSEILSSCLEEGKWTKSKSTFWNLASSSARTLLKAWDLSRKILSRYKMASLHSWIPTWWRKSKVRQKLEMCWLQLCHLATSQFGCFLEAHFKYCGGSSDRWGSWF